VGDFEMIVPTLPLGVAGAIQTLRNRDSGPSSQHARNNRNESAHGTTPCGLAIAFQARNVAPGKHMAIVPATTNPSMLMKTIPANTCSTTLRTETEPFCLLMS